MSRKPAPSGRGVRVEDGGMESPLLHVAYLHDLVVENGELAIRTAFLVRHRRHW